MKKNKVLGWKAAIAMMKPVRKRGGNSAPKLRLPFLEVPQESLDKALNSYTRAMGIKQAFNLHQYKNLQKEQAESPQSMADLQSCWILCWESAAVPR